MPQPSITTSCHFISRPTTPKRVNFADEYDNKKCLKCAVSFSIIHLKHTCRRCDKNFCGKCSTTTVTTVNNTLFRERLCSDCTPLSNSLEHSKGGTFTPSKLNGMFGQSDGKNAASLLWSADTETDSDTDSTSEEIEIQSNRENESNSDIIKENLSLRISDDLRVEVVSSGIKSGEQKSSEGGLDFIICTQHRGLNPITQYFLHSFEEICYSED